MGAVWVNRAVKFTHERFHIGTAHSSVRLQAVQKCFFVNGADAHTLCRRRHQRVIARAVKTVFGHRSRDAGVDGRAEGIDVRIGALLAAAAVLFHRRIALLEHHRQLGVLVEKVPRGAEIHQL